jgi:iron uptake system EfeUOB component EfeO/EfeM
MSRHRAAIALLVGAVALAAAASGCGSSGGSAASTQPASEPVATVAGTTQSPDEVAAAAMDKSSAPGPGPELSPLRPAAFRRPVAEYRVYAGRQAAAMQADVDRLRAALRRGDRGAAKRSWASAYDRYLRLGAAYGALGDLDQTIDGNPGRLPGGTADPHFTGLHRIEMGLWTGAPTAALSGQAALLAANVRHLRRIVPTKKIGPLEYATRAHEILEDAQRDMLSGVDAPWSGAGLRATADSLAATEVVIGTLRPLLAGRGSALEPVENGLAGFGAELARVRRAHGGRWPRLEAMTQIEHERVDGSLGSLLERLAAVPGSLEAKPPPAIPTIASQQ